MTETFRCSACKQKKARQEFYEHLNKNSARPVTYECRACKKGRARGVEIFNRAFHKYGTICDWCLLPRPIVAAGACAACLKTEGVQLCARCSNLLPLSEFSQATDTVCRPCVAEMFTFTLPLPLPQPPAPPSPPSIPSDPTAPQLRRHHRGPGTLQHIGGSFGHLPPQDRVFAATLWTKYAITLQQYQRLLEAQEGKCAICKKPPVGKRRLVVDHNHATEQVRGLIHGTCNSMLGFAKDSPEILRSGATYLEGGNQAALDKSAGVG